MVHSYRDRLDTIYQMLQSNDNKSLCQTHAGLWLDKYIEQQRREDVGSRTQLVKDVSSIAIPEEYTLFYKSWQKLLVEQGARCREAHAKSRMIVGLGGESVLETSITLHHTYGVPYIPGSALKGLASSYVRNYLGPEWQKGSNAFAILFGDTEEAGYITFFDAIYIPDNKKKPLYPDIITVHHQKYYQRGNNITAPADWDSPIPVPFLSATGSYLVALAVSDPDLEEPRQWIDKTFEILQMALLDIGIGAKTSSGYGRMVLRPEKQNKVPEPPPEQSIDPEIAKNIADLVQKVQSLPDTSVSSQIRQYYDRWLRVKQYPQSRALGQAIVNKVVSSDCEKSIKKNPWYQMILVSLK